MVSFERLLLVYGGKGALGSGMYCALIASARSA
jgi:hypothetical protein